MPADASWAVLKVFAGAGLDPGQPWQLALRVTRAEGQIYPELISRDFPFSYALPLWRLCADAQGAGRLPSDAEVRARLDLVD